ncbi:MAG TPA: T9SS type A sorting domain-containing protein [Bacteroidia bacterium]|nr:T9SS type A sorting domain-containing protein [Bacteroidia bacterium]HNT80678.1 T9SS type A sorting domain-containing protein [Bacteroidia bacterium]
MKKTLLTLSLFLASGLMVVNAQVPSVSFDRSHNATIDAENTNILQAPSSIVKVNPNPSVTSVTCATMGTAANAYGGYTRPSRSMVYADPALNTVTFVHRSNPGVDGSSNSGNFFYDYSTDGGVTWTNQNGPLYLPSPNAGRYPQATIYNPPGNTNPANAYISFFGPALGATWECHVHGSAAIGTGSGYQQIDSFAVLGYDALIPNTMYQTQGGTAWVIDWSYNGTDYTDTLWLFKGTWNTTNNAYDYTRTGLYFPASLDAGGAKNFAYPTIAFDATGMIGYIFSIAHDDYALNPNDAFYPIIHKTTDGGATWSAPIRVDLSNMDSYFQVGAGTSYTLGFQADIAVDANGNLHAVVPVGVQGANPFSIVSGGGGFVIADIYTTDGGTTWYAEVLGQPMTFRGEFGTALLAEDNRMQVSTTWDHTKLFFTYFDTDTLLFGSTDGNKYPDAWVRAYDVTSGNWTALENKTAGSCADALMTFGYISQWVLGTSGTYTIPAGYMTILADDTNPVDNTYVGDITVSDADFTTPGAGILLGLLAGVNEQENSLFNLSNVYPNPAVNGSTSLNINMVKANDVNISITNILGQEVKSFDFVKVSAGQHTLNINTNGLNSGVYFITTKVQDKSATTKLIVQ